MTARSSRLALLLLALAGTAGAIPQSDAYRTGQGAIRAEDWARAVEAFQQARQEHAEEADAALYWEAYALMQEGRARAAERRIRELERRHADSPWIDDGRALLAGRGTDQDATGGGDFDESLQLYALGSLLERDPERALPRLLRLVEQTDSDRTRRDAMFLLGMSDDPAASEAIARIAREGDDPQLRAQAIHALGVSGGGRAKELLRELVDGSDDREVQLAVVRAAVPLEATELLREIARDSEDADVQRSAIHALGALDQTELLRELYPTLDSREARSSVLQALAMADDLAGLDLVLASESEPELRQAAIRGIAMVGDAAAVDRLRAVYADPRGPEDRLVVLESMLIVDEAEAAAFALAIAGDTDEPELAARAIQVLAMTGATDALRELYGRADDQRRVTIIQAMAIADDPAGLVQILETEQEPTLRAHAIRAMAHADDDLAMTDRLVTLYGGAASEERQAILDALLVREDAEAVIRILEQTEDREQQRRLVQILSMMDDERATDYLFELLDR